MGHTKKTHAEFYRLPQDVYQTAKVAKVLLLLEKGRGKCFQGKTINEIELEKDIYYSSNSSEDEDEKEGNTVVKKRCKRMANKNVLERKEEEQTATDLHLSEEKVQENNRKKINTMNILCKDNLMDINESDIDEVTEPENRASKTNNNRKKINTKKEDTVNTSNNSLDSNESDTDATELESHASRMNIKRKKNHKNESPKAKKNLGRIRWSQKEKEIVIKYFAKHVQNKITPKKHECDQFLVKYGKELQNKDWVRVKTFVYNSFKGN